ncbi:MAG: tetratricopeptide repeat protein [Firmicutes bacterium]|nr:tetratricopeptide repeat protein [Bacillota bacterium]
MKMNKNGGYHYNIALNYFQNDNLTKAIETLNEGLNTESNNIEILNLLGLCYFKKCNFRSARNKWKRSMQIKKEDNKAKYYLERLNNKKFINMRKYYNLGVTKIDNQEYKEAIALFLEIIKRNKDLVEPYILVGLCNYKLKDYSQAIYYWEEAKSKDKGSLKIKSYINDAQISMMEVKEENNKKNNIKSIIIILLITISVGGIYQLKFNLFKKTQNKNTVTESTENKIPEKESEFKKDDMIVKNNDTNEKIKQKKVKEVDIKLEDEQSIFNNALELYKKGQHNDAVILFNKLINYGTVEYLIPEAIFFAANSYIKIDNVEKGVEYFKKYINEYEEGNYYEESLYKTGLILYRAGKQEEAKELLKKLINKSPNSIYVNSKVKMIIKE